MTKGITESISGSTVKRWLREDKIKPWQHRSWQKPTDPDFVERAEPILDLYAKANFLAKKGHIVVCADEKTSIQARKAQGDLLPAIPNSTMKVPDRYGRKGALQLFAALLVSTGETLAECFDCKKFIDFKAFLLLLFASAWCKAIKCLHLILDNVTTHAPKQIHTWIQSLNLSFKVKIHWLPVNASWLDQIEITFSVVQRKVLTPNDFDDLGQLRGTLLGFLNERNEHPEPIAWGFTKQKLREKLGMNL